MTITIPFCYCLLALAYIWLSRFEEFPLSFLLKILPLLLLSGWLIKSRATQPWLLAALAFSMLGDVLLAWDGERLFVFGLAAFLLGHLSYLMNLRPFTRFYPALLLPYLGFAAVVLSLMWPQLGAMALPVCIYIAVILSMSFGTWCSGRANPWLIAGGLFFIASDSLIGLNKFYQAIPYAGSWIMLTYYAAQFALVRGFLQAPTQLQPQSD